jgi:hypothetical protein
MKLLMENWRCFLNEDLDIEAGDDNIQGLVDVYLENPLDYTMPESVAFHPEILKARREVFKDFINACDVSRGKLLPFPGTRASLDANKELHDAKDRVGEISNELDRLGAQTDQMIERAGKEGFEELKNSPGFQSLVAQQEDLKTELRDAKAKAGEAGREISRNIHRAMEAHIEFISSGCPPTSTGYWGGNTAQEELSYHEEKWRRKYDRKQSTRRYQSRRREKEDSRHREADAWSREREEKREHERELRRRRRERELEPSPAPESGEDLMRRLRARRK